jgi:hypothetical protein
LRRRSILDFDPSKRRMGQVRSPLQSPFLLTFILALFSCSSEVLAPKYTVISTQSAGGIISVSPQQDSYNSGDQITVTATPSQGYVFSYWSGSLNGTTNPATFKVNGSASISAVFTPLQNTYTITISSTTGGTVALSPSKANYTSGEVVTVTAIPTTGYSFSSWGGDLSGTTNPATLTVTKDNTISASFTQSTYTITVTQGSGGTISLSPSKGSYTYGEIVNVSATAAGGYSFGSWGGDLSGTANSMTVAVLGNMSISAHFAQSTYTIAVTQPAGGIGTISLSPPQGSYNAGDVVSVSATAASGYSFSSWGGDLIGTANPTTVAVTRDMDITAYFAQETVGSYTLSVGGMTGGTIILSPNKTKYNAGDVVSVAAVAAAGYSFNSWGGGLSGGSNPQSFIVTGNMNISASFTQVGYAITVNQGTGGTITITPSQSAYHYGDVVTITATSASGYSFASWGGGVAGSANPTMVTVAGNTTVSANFVRNSYSVTVNQSTGGVVTITPADPPYYSGDMVQVIATANVGYGFSSWGGDLTGSAYSQTVTVTGNIIVSALFTPIAYTVTLSPVTGGTITVTPSKTSYVYGESVTATATADSGYVFTSWGVDLVGSTTPQEFTISRNMSISASFEPVYTITLTQGAGGSISVSPVKGTYSSGEIVMATAAADGGYVFFSWGGDLTGSTNPQTFSITKNMSITATFSPVYTITLNQSTGGTISASPSKSTFIGGEIVSVTATAKPGYIFSSWSSGLTGSTNPSTFPITANLLVSAAFIALPEYVYVINCTSNDVSAFSLDTSTGTLISISNSPFAAGQSPLCAATDPMGKYLFVGNWNSDNVSGFTINVSTGALTATSGSPFPAGTGPACTIVDPSGRFLYTANQYSNNVSAFFPQVNLPISHRP